MKRKIIFMSSVVMLSLVVLSGCGSSSKEDQDSAKDKDNKVSEKTKEKDDFINDNDSYFFVIDGKKFSAGDRIADVMDLGYGMKSEEQEEEIPAHKYMIGAGGMRDAENSRVFVLTPFNTTSSAIKVSDSVIGGLDLSDVWAEDDEKAFNIEVYGGLKLGSTEAEVKKVFGEPSNVVEVNDNTTALKYDSDEVYRGFDFTIKDGKVTTIQWQNLVFNEK